MRISSIFLASVLFSLCMSSIISYTINSAFALEAKLDTNVKANIGSENEKSSGDTSIESSTAVSMKAESKNKAISHYSSSYNMTKAQADTSVTVQSDEHLYNPGDVVAIEGTVSSNVIAGLGEALSLVTVTVVDVHGEIIAEEETKIDSDGEYFVMFTIPDDADLGRYTVTSTLKVDADVLDLLDLDVAANLESSSRFVVANAVIHEITVDDNAFVVSISSNSKVSNVEFEKEQKKISFMVEGESGTEGVAEVTIPTSMLSGEMTVMIDGHAMASNDVMVKSNTEAETTLEINYHHSVHTVDIVGTQVVPEFPHFALIIMVVGSIAGIFLASTRISHIPKI